MDVFGNIRIYELISFNYEFYRNILMYLTSMGITGKESKAGYTGVKSLSYNGNYNRIFFSSIYTTEFNYNYIGSFSMESSLLDDYSVL
jgi:hypothetical protein